MIHNIISLLNFNVVVQSGWLAKSQFSLRLKMAVCGRAAFNLKS